MTLILAGVAMGLAGTLAMDVWAQVLNRAFGLPLPNWGNVGRWAGHLRTRVFHQDIGSAAPIPNETALGWAVHYGVGILYGLAFVLVAGQAWLADPAFLPLWLFALATIAAGWFLLHPGLGLGWALSRTAAPWTGRAMGLVAHTVFGLGMWGAALAL
jgi:hypothetical protein